MTMAPAHLLALLKFSTGLNPLALTESKYFGDSFDKFSVALRGFREGTNFIRRTVNSPRLAPLHQQQPLSRLRSTGAFPRDSGVPVYPPGRFDTRARKNRTGETFLGGSYGPDNYNKMIHPRDLSLHRQRRVEYTRNQIFKDPENRAAFAKYIYSLPPAPDELTRNFKKIMFSY